jgi:hypothetical protein
MNNSVSEQLEPAATGAMRDLIEFVAITQYEPMAAQALKEFFKVSTPIITCYLDTDATKIAGNSVFRFDLQETLMRYLVAFRAGQRPNGHVQRVVQGHNSSLMTDKL